MKVHRIDHVGIIVNDLPAAKAFFLDFGLELQGEGSLEGEWLDKIVGLNDVKTSFAFFRVPEVGRHSTVVRPSCCALPLLAGGFLVWQRLPTHVEWVQRRRQAALQAPKTACRSARAGHTTDHG